MTTLTESTSQAASDGPMGEVPRTLRAVVRGSLIGVVVAFTGVGGSLYLSGHDAGVALGIGGMAAFWGGLGFGSMLGGTLHLIRHSGEPYGHSRAPGSQAVPLGRRDAELTPRRAEAWTRQVGGAADAPASSGS